MTKIVVVGDSHTGKSTFAHVACGIPIPHNMFRSTNTETYYCYGTETRTEITVVPGEALDDRLASACEGAEGIIALYNYEDSIHSAQRWLRRVGCAMGGIQQVPIIICQHKHTRLYTRHDRRLVEVLQRYPLAEHTNTSIEVAHGIQDCVNRLITHIRRRHPSPLARHSGGDE